MKVKEIMDLIDFISKSDLEEVNIETQEFKVSVRRNAPPSAPPVSKGVPAADAAPALMAQAQEAAVPAAPAPASSAGSNLIEIRSPMIGTFYRSSGPGTNPFVVEGDRISVGQTVCIIEAMKLFNEIESEVSGTIVKILLDNSTPVEFDQPLFLVDPSV
jgi:acetyl-CoA carboxylase biotin carboxyl carrier protein